MNRTIAIAIGAIVILGLVALTYGATQSNPNGMTIVLYDDAGNKVWETTTTSGFFGFGFQNVQGATITKAVVTVTYTVAGLPAGTAVSVIGAETVTTRLNTVTAGIVNTKTNSWSDTKTTATHSKEWLLSEVITPVDSSGMQYGWSVEFNCVMSASATVDGVAKTATKTLMVSLTVLWVDSVMTIDGAISLS